MEEQFIVKYKPYCLDDFFLDNPVKTMIRLLIDIEDLNVLFTGNSNSGKTSLLYAIIREYYGLSKLDKLPEHNLLFINNLKEQGIHFFRNEMKNFCQSHSSVYGKKKMIIIDDLDMINQQNQQVFCNYIDKYKENVCFVSVCSNIQKIIENIQSRTHILKIQSPTNSNLNDFMEKIMKKENMEFTNDAKDYLILISNYSIRALINNLEKISIHRNDNTPIEIELCKTLCTNISFGIFEKYIDLLRNNRLNEAIQILYEINDFGYSVIDILDYFFTFVKITDLFGENEKYKIIHILCKYITIFHNVHEDTIELALFTNNLLDILSPVAIFREI
jgi:DNA polymerase III delta prime subunit